MPHSNAAEQLPQQPHEEEIEDLTHEARQIPPPVPDEKIEDLTDEAVQEKSETDEALEQVRHMGWTKEAEKRNAEAKAKRKADAEFQALEASEKLGKTNKLPDMTDQTVFADPKEQSEYEKNKADMLKARKDIFFEKKAMEAVDELRAEADAENAAKGAGPAPKKKGFWSRLFGRK